MTYTLKAYPVGPLSPKGWSIEPGGANLEWMAQTPEQAALRCLPLLMAGQAGWVIKSPVGFKVTWNGRKTGKEHKHLPQQDNREESLEFKYDNDAELYGTQIVSNFGYGIVTFKIPWLFRTSEGMGLLIRGPANTFKDNVVALDGLVESDWAPYTFTMNWKIIQPKRPVWFKKGEPVCMIIPFPIAMLEQTKPEFASFDDDPELFDQFLQWRGHRQKQSQDAKATGSTVFRLDYLKGHHPDGSPTREHRSSLKLAAFENRQVTT